MKPPLVSILIPVHNAAQWLAPCIQSALGQSHPSVEVLAWDDGSKDASRDVLASFGDRIRWFGGEQRGGNYARNQLLAAAKGEWLQFLDADDYLEPQKIERQIAEADELAHMDVLYSPVWIETWRNGQVIEREASAMDTSVDLFVQWISWHLPQTGGALWRRSFLLQLQGWNEAMPCCQEHELYLRALKTSRNWKYCPSPGAIYRIWSEQTVCRKDPLQVIRTRTALIDDLLAWLSATRQLTPAHRAAAGQAFFEMARTWARHDLSAARVYLNEQRARGGIALRGPAAPLNYRIAYRLFGFRIAESLARRLR